MQNVPQTHFQRTRGKRVQPIRENAPEAKRIEIRPAGEQDLQRLLEMAHDFYESAGLARIAPWDAQTVDALFCESLRDPERRVILAHEGEKIVGMIWLAMGPFPFNPEAAFCREIAWWVEPEHRKSGAGKALLDAAEAWADDEGASHMLMAALGNSGQGKIAQTYLQRGYRLLESHYLRRIT